MHLNSTISRPAPALSRVTTSSLSLSRRQPLLQRSKSTPSPRNLCGGSTAGEICGGTTAACTAVWCCCPCALVNLFVLAIYKVPAGICRLAIRRRRRRRLLKQGLLPARGEGERRICRCCEIEMAVHPVDDEFLEKEKDENDDVLELEKEMWSKFYGAGFWRSASQRDTVSSPRDIKVVMQ